MKMLSLFSGIGGMDLAAQWAGIETVAFVEINPFCQRVLRKNFGEDIVIFDDVRELTAGALRQRGVGRVDIVAGGFPCQDISEMGRRVGIGGERSGLWSEMLRVVCDIRPRYVVVENVSALLERGIGRVLGDLSEAGFDAEWETLSACAFGAPHTRERVFIVAYPSREPGLHDTLEKQGQGVSVFDCLSVPAVQDSFGEEFAPASRLCRTADGIPGRVERAMRFGNAVVPQVVYPIFKAIVDAEESNVFL